MPRHPLPTLGANLRKRRKAIGLSQEALALRCEMHQTDVSAIERGKRNPSVLSVVRLARVLRTTPAKLLAGVR